MLSYEEYLKQNIKYDGTTSCFVSGCTKPALYEGGDNRFYCGMCEEHAYMRKQYENYKRKYGYEHREFSDKIKTILKENGL